MSRSSFTTVTHGDAQEPARRHRLVELLKACPLPQDELLPNLGLFLTPQTLSRILFMDFLYRQIIPVQGVVIEFGCRWGQNVSIFTALRGIYEPFNRLRKIIGFDTFAGFPSTSEEDGAKMVKGGYGVTENYEAYLSEIVRLQEEESPLSHIRKHEIIKGDVMETVAAYFKKHPHTIVALAYFDMDLYGPTKACLELIKDRITPGTVLGFDELNDPDTPGETLAFAECLGLRNVGVKRFPHNARTSYVVIPQAGFSP